jgi:hypothetical protein
VAVEFVGSLEAREVRGDRDHDELGARCSFRNGMMRPQASFASSAR